MTAQVGLCQTWLETQNVGFLMRRLNLYFFSTNACRVLNRSSTMRSNGVMKDCFDLCFKSFSVYSQPHRSRMKQKGLWPFVQYKPIHPGVCYASLFAYVTQIPCIPLQCKAMKKFIFSTIPCPDLIELGGLWL